MSAFLGVASASPSTLTTTTPMISPEGQETQPEGGSSQIPLEQHQANDECIPRLPENLPGPSSAATQPFRMQGPDQNDAGEDAVHNPSRDFQVPSPLQHVSTVDICIQNPLSVPCSKMFPPSVQDQSGPNLRRKRENLNANLMTPPSMITPRLTNDPIPANKFCWILHPCHENLVVAQGKSGVAWKSKSKLAADCVISEQLVQVHRTFVKEVEAMCFVTRDEFKTLDDALPPSSGKHKFMKWDTRHLVMFSPWQV